MGQYFKPFVERNGKIEVFHGHKFVALDPDYFSGIKLTEHSWLLNPFVLAVAKRIYQKPCRVAWVGDYAEDDDLPVIAEHAGEAAYSLKGAYRKYPGRKLKETDFSMRGKFLVNHTQKKYVDIDAFAEATDDDGWVLNPPPLFTAIGNGRGAGDYYGKNQKKVGAWALDVLSIEDAAPKGYDEDAETLFYPC